MENKTKLAELLAQTESISAMSTANLDSFKTFVVELGDKEYHQHGSSTLWHELYDCEKHIRSEQQKRAKENFADTFLILLEEFQKRCDSMKLAQ
jgi:hypothetical protein